MSKDFNETLLHRIRSRWSCASGGRMMSLMRRRAIEKSGRRAARLSWVPRFHLGRATAQTTIECCQLCCLLLVSTCDFSRLLRSQQASSDIRQAAVSCRARSAALSLWTGGCYSPVLSVQHAAKLGKCTKGHRAPRHVCSVRVRGVCHSAAMGKSIRREFQSGGFWYDLIRHVLGTVERRLC